MPNIKSSEKDVKRSAEKRMRNKAIKSEMKTSLKNAEAAIVDNGEDAAGEVKAAVSDLDKAVSKGVIHKNKAARKKSRMARKMAKASQA